MSLQTQYGLALYVALTIVCLGSPTLAETYPIVDTGQQRCYDNSIEINYPKAGEPFFGQDAQYQGNQPAYRDNGDGTITDLVTGLMWQKDPGPKKTFNEAVAGASACQSRWIRRLASAKHQGTVLADPLQRRGYQPSRHGHRGTCSPFIDTTTSTSCMAIRPKANASSIRRWRRRPSTSARRCAATKRCSA